MPTPLTPAEFKALAKFKGWTYRALAQRWGLQPESISAIARDPNRATRYDDMLHGVPNQRYLARDLRRLAGQVAEAVSLATGPVATDNAPAVPKGPGFRFHGYIVAGSVVTATTQVGSMAEEGSRGVVFNVQTELDREVYGIIFETGLWDWFPPNYIELYVADIGLIDEGIKNYVFTCAETLKDDFDNNKFDFWPVVPS